MNPSYRIETRCVQAGWEPKNGQPRVLPIFQSTTFKYDTAQELGQLFDLEIGGHFYTRLSNPTLEAVETKIAALEGGVGAMLTASGQAAIFMAIFNLCKAGDHIVSSSTIYGGAYNLFSLTFKRAGINATFVHPDDSPETIAAAFRPETKAFFAETVSNPALTVADIEKLAHIAHEKGVPLVVDNTFPSPILCRPIEWGADIVLHSTSKYMDGHAQVLGGVIVDSGKFNWANGKFPEFTTPDASYHNIVYAEKFGAAAYITKARVQIMRDLGAQQTPFAAYILNLGLETLHLRMERHVQNALTLAQYLEKHPKVAWVNYPGLPSSPHYALTQKYLPNGTCGVISCGIKGGREAAMSWMENLKLSAIVTHVADTRTSVIHPASTTHRQLSDPQLVAAGVKPEMVRISVGIENIQDILDDCDRAFSVLS